VRARATGNPYDVIGVKRGTSKANVRQAFRKLAQTEHPDVKPGDPRAAERFSELVSAYNQIMGDELLPDDLLSARVKWTPRYKQQLQSEANRLVNKGYITFFPAVAITFLAAALYAFATLPDREMRGALSALGVNPQVQQLVRFGLKNKEGISIETGARVQLLREEQAFRSSFARFHDALNGFSNAKLERRGMECQVTRTFQDRTFTCLFSDGRSFDFPWETVDGYKP